MAGCPFPGVLPNVWLGSNPLGWAALLGRFPPYSAQTPKLGLCDYDLPLPQTPTLLNVPLNCLCIELFGKEGLPKWFIGSKIFLKCKRCRRRRFHPWVRKIPWRRAGQPSPVFLPGESQGQRRWAGYNAWVHKELDTTEGTEHTLTHLGRKHEEKTTTWSLIFQNDSNLFVISWSKKSIWFL